MSLGASDDYYAGAADGNTASPAPERLRRGVDAPVVAKTIDAEGNNLRALNPSAALCEMAELLIYRRGHIGARATLTWFGSLRGAPHRAQADRNREAET